MSRATRERRLEAKESWPNLSQFLDCYFHQDWMVEFTTVEAALEQAIIDWPLDGRAVTISEWRDWNVKKGWSRNLHLTFNDSFGLAVHFDDDVAARRFMNRVHDRLLESVRAEQVRS